MKNVKSNKDVIGPQIKTKGDKNVVGSMEGVVAEGDVKGATYEEKD